jgi:hypothetical protein
MLLFLQIKLVVWQVSHTPLISPTQVAWLIHATNACFAKPLAAYFLPVQSLSLVCNTEEKLDNG